MIPLRPAGLEGVPVACLWTRGGNLILAVGEHEVELTPQQAVVFADQILRRVAKLGAEA